MNKSALQYGLLTGVILVIYNLLLYVMGMDVYTKWYLQLLTYPIIWAGMIWGGLKLRQLNGGYLSYKESYVGMLLIALGALGIYTVWGIILFSVINPDLAQIVQDKAIENMIVMMEKWNVPEANIAEAVQKQEEQLKAQFTVVGQLKSLVYSMIFTAVIAALLALIPKKVEEAVAQSDSDTQEG